MPSGPGSLRATQMSSVQALPSSQIASVGVYRHCPALSGLSRPPRQVPTSQVRPWSHSASNGDPPMMMQPPPMTLGTLLHSPLPQSRGCGHSASASAAGRRLQPAESTVPSPYPVTPSASTHTAPTHSGSWPLRTTHVSQGQCSCIGRHGTRMWIWQGAPVRQAVWQHGSRLR